MELLVVILIVGILAAIAVPVFLTQRKRAVDASLRADLRSAAIVAETLVGEDPSAATFGATAAAIKTRFADAGFRGSPTNIVQVAGGPRDGFCLGAFSYSGTGGAWGYVYDSTSGGMHAQRESYAQQPAGSPCHLALANLT